MSVSKQEALCQLDGLAEGQCLAFTIERPGEDPRDIFLVHQQGQVYGYENRCPHTGVNLNWLPDQFLDIDAEFIQCSVHGALFRIDDGYCVRGPCAGQSLQPVMLAIRNGQVYLRD